ncbi:MAG TPA: metalloregulator ArsR/SmtB family transcription factor [Patescibacteria group bacterium]
MDKIFKALADKNRRKIISLLKDTDLSVNELLIHFNIRQATLSNHLSILKKTNLVSNKVKGKQRIYSLNHELFEKFIGELENFIGHNNLTVQSDIKVRR